MNKHSLILALLLISGFGLNASAIEISIGDRPIELPLPEGFVELTPEMTPYYESMKAYKAPSNIRYTTLITSDAAQAILNGEAIDLGRYIAVETEKTISEVSATFKDFSDLRTMVRTQIGQTYAEVEKQLPDMLNKGNAVLSDEFSVDAVVEVGGMVPLPVHLDTDTAVAHSMYLSVGASVDNQDLDKSVIAATVLFLHVKDKVMFVYVYGPESDLEWTRETAARMATDIVAANPLTAELEQALNKTGFGINWNQVIKSALIGGAIGLVVFFVRRRKEE